MHPSTVWIEELLQVIREHRNIFYDWQFTDSQKQALQHYHDANKALVDLMKNCNVSEEVRQEIEDTLLLPIATLQERQPELYESKVKI